MATIHCNSAFLPLWSDITVQIWAASNAALIVVQFDVSDSYHKHYLEYVVFKKIPYLLSSTLSSALINSDMLH